MLQIAYVEELMLVGLLAKEVKQSPRQRENTRYEKSCQRRLRDDEDTEAQSDNGDGNVIPAAGLSEETQTAGNIDKQERNDRNVDDRRNLLTECCAVRKKDERDDA